MGRDVAMEDKTFFLRAESRSCIVHYSLHSIGQNLVTWAHMGKDTWEIFSLPGWPCAQPKHGDSIGKRKRGEWVFGDNQWALPQLPISKKKFKAVEKNYKYDKSTNRHKVNREMQDKIICGDEVKGGGRDYMQS